jgi:4-amino-4-deoxy-L-arabinose transferase-like glycosyltransferase
MLTGREMSVAMSAKAPRTEHENGGRPGSRSREWLLLSAVLLAAFAVRLYRLGSFPDTVLADEADNVQDAVRILHGVGPENGIFGLDWTPQPAVSVYKEAAFIALLGFNIAALRLPSALFSTLALLPFYLLLRRQFSMTASLLATVLLATNVWYLNFSRSGWNNIDICLYSLAAMYYLMRSLDLVPAGRSRGLKGWASFALAGFFCAMGLYGYPSGRAITLAVIAFAPAALAVNWRHRRSVALGYLLLFGVEALVIAPHAAYVAEHWERFNTRSNVVLVFNSEQFKSDPAGTIKTQLIRNVLGPWAGSVNNTPQYSPPGEPQLDKLAGALALGGIGLAVASKGLRSRPETWLWTLMLFAGWGTTQLLTVNTPNGARGIGYMPTLVFFTCVGLDAMIKLTGWFVRRAAKGTSIVELADRIPATIAAIAVLVAGYGNLQHYVDWQSSPSTRQARYLYITAREFPQWAAAIEGLARERQGSMNVGQWRERYPIEDRSNPYGMRP